MKTIKPNRLGLLCRVFESDRRYYFVVTLLVGFPFDAPRSLLTEAETWKLAGDELGEGAILDEGLSKAQGEVLVTGRCFTPRGQPLPVTYARVALGTVDKTVAVIGDRCWRWGVPTAPQPFTEMPIDYAHAFGGVGYALNPLGKGVAPVGDDGERVHPLPNIEDPKRLITSPSDRLDPTGFGPYDLTWPQRFSKVGTYDAEWLETRYPGVAKDMDPTFFNTAPADQRVQGYFRGDEAFVVENMHPEMPRIEGQLPGAVTRAFINQKTSHGEVLRELSTRLDTIRLFPNAQRGVLVYRGMVEIAEDDAADVLQLVVACEDLTAPRPVDHYRDVLRLRLDPKRKVVAALRDVTGIDLMPAASAGWPAAALPGAEASPADGRLFAENLKRRTDAERAKARAHLESEGLVPAEYGFVEPPPEEAPPGLDEPERFAKYLEEKLAFGEEQKARIGAASAKAEEEARALCASMDVDYDAMMAAQKKKTGGPPKFSAADQMEMLRGMLQLARDGGVPMVDLEAAAQDPKATARLVDAEARLRQQYRVSAHLQPPAPDLEADESQILRALVTAAVKGRESLAERDLTGADLSGLDLAGLDLRRAFIEGANLRGANLANADLREAVLARADLSKANLTRAKLAGANLGGARLHDAVLDGADLSGAMLMRADLARASFRGANLARADFMEAVFGAADLSEVVAPGIMLVRVDLTNAKLAGADLTKGSFVEVALSGADLSRSKLSSVSFVTVKGAGTVFRGANLDKAVFALGSELAHADFREASLRGATMRTTQLRGAQFQGAQLDAADFSECDLDRSSFYRASAIGTLWVRTELTAARMVAVNLMQAILQKANLSGTDFTGANLFRADLAMVRVDGATKFDDTNLKHVRVDPRRRDEQG